MSNYHVTKNPGGGWKVLKAGSERASSIENIQRKAEQEAKRLAGNTRGGEVRIHRPDGTIRDSDTVKPANDPCPPKDLKY